MKQVRFPIRLKIMASLVVALTLVVIVISFTMANFFHEDKQSYMSDWTSIAVLSTAQEARSLLEGYTRQAKMGSRILLDRRIARTDRERLVGSLFDSFPEMLQIAVYRDGKEIDAARDEASFADAGFTSAALEEHRATHPRSSAPVAAGETWVENATLDASSPAFILSFAEAQDAASGPVIVSALLRLDPLLSLGGKFRVFEISLAASDGTLLAHPEVARVARHEQSFRPQGIDDSGPSFRAGSTIQYLRDGTPMIGGFAPVQFAGITAMAEIPQSAAYLASRDLLGQLLAVAAILLALVAVGGRLWSRRITRPIERLSEATRVIAGGRFDVRVDVGAHDEIGALAGSFNQMASELNQREAALIAAQAQLVQSEKLAAFGQLGAGIAHEVKNPLTGILGCSQLALMEVEEGSFVYTNLALIEKETKRCKAIIDNLLKFARQEKAEMAPIEVTPVVEDTCAIVHHQMELNRVKLECDLAPGLPCIRGNANQLQQVLMNLVVNAQQALAGNEGRIRIVTRSVEGGRLEILIEDNGPGIPEEIQSKLFEPFFTTKPPGQGTGLGLSVSFGIIQEHGGGITLESQPGHGTKFRITLPALAPADVTRDPREKRA